MSYEKISGFSDEIDSNIDVQFDVLCKLGLKYFEPRGINGKNISLLDDGEVAELKAKMDACGIKASSIGSPIGKVKVSDSFEEHFATFERVVRTARMLGAKYIRMFSFYPDDSGVWHEGDREEIIRRLKIMIDYARNQGVVLLHENEKDIFGDSVERCLDLMSTLGCENFRAVFDPANFVQCGVDTVKAFDLLYPYVEYIHIKDAKVGDGTVVPAGLGDGNFKYILTKLFENGYKGFLSLEPHLGSFEGLADLELDDKMLDLPKSGEGTFTLAYNSLCDILKEII